MSMWLASRLMLLLRDNWVAEAQGTTKTCDYKQFGKMSVNETIEICALKPKPSFD
jgi:hypothetical protein